MNWRLCLVLLVLAGGVNAADWTGARWDTLRARWYGRNLFFASAALQCRGDTVFFFVYADTARRFERYEFYRWDPATGITETAELPPVPLYNTHLSYDSVDRRIPAAMGRNKVYRFREDHWDSLAIEYSDSLGDFYNSDFCFDSLGALHYSFLRWWGTSDSVWYGRRGGNISNSDQVLPNSHPMYTFMTWHSFLWSDAPGQALVSTALYDVSEYWIDPDFPDYFQPTVRAYGIYRVMDSGIMSVEGVTECGGNNENFVVAPNGRWLFGYRNPFDLRCLMKVPDGSTIGLYPFQEECFKWRGAFNETTNQFEIAIIPRGAPPYRVVTAEWDSSNWGWSPALEVELPTTIRSFQFVIDERGGGHLFALDSAYFLHYGAPLNGSAEPAPLPAAFNLSVAPNPFNSTTTITYELPVESHVTLTVSDVLGRERVLLEDARKNAGRERIVLDEPLPSGVYFLRLQTETFSATRKLLSLR